MFWTYILENSSGRFYIGHTNDLARRLSEHNSIQKIGHKYTHKYEEWKLIWSETFFTRAEAMKREKDLKRLKSSKWIRDNLLNKAKHVPIYRD